MFDKLERIFEMQKELIEEVKKTMGMELIGYKDLILAMGSELDEILQEFPWKHWKSYNCFELDKDHLLEECTDLLFFLIELVILTTGASADDLFKKYMDKFVMNIRRLQQEAQAKKAKRLEEEKVPF